MEDWAEIRRLHRAEGVAISEVARQLGISRNTVRAALASDRPPKYERAAQPRLVDGVEAEVRALLVEFPRMPATVIAQRTDRAPRPAPHPAPAGCSGRSHRGIPREASHLVPSSTRTTRTSAPRCENHRPASQGSVTVPAFTRQPGIPAAAR